ncbi:hypothetical protein KR093_008177 [Drosophila rubida]|uniref:LysM domain-containing protein n=1 Tax=Drosophila rubida TaxID=30044 RepID=A0AAD4KEE6_9MUSC|nr:hypothetical protein KR093_008177 [Drosophila rubida]
MTLCCAEPVAPNLSDGRLWQRHEVRSDDTLAHLALKCGTTIGQLRRANRMHSQDIVLMRRYVWLPVLRPAGQEMASQAWRDEGAATAGRADRKLPPHFQRQSDENVDDFAQDCDPLLITTRCM